MIIKTHTILIVDDEKSLQSVLKAKLIKENFSVLEAANGKDGLDLAISKRPDLILLDLIMPIMDGMTMLMKLRKDAWGKTARVIILTNLTDSTKVDEAKKHNSYEYLIKSNWKMTDLVNKIHECLKS
ncbi:MAG: response regulator [Patescibacteria group bacterium]